MQTDGALIHGGEKDLLLYLFKVIGQTHFSNFYGKIWVTCLMFVSDVNPVFPPLFHAHVKHYKFQTTGSSQIRKLRVINANTVFSLSSSVMSMSALCCLYWIEQQLGLIWVLKDNFFFFHRMQTYKNFTHAGNVIYKLDWLSNCPFLLMV